MGVTSFFHGYFSVLLIGSPILQAFGINCPDGWMFYRNHCYKFFEDFLPWIQAEVDCKLSQKTSYLVSISDEEEMSRIKSWLLPIHISQPIWIGLNRLQGSKRRWRWTNMSTSIYRNWKNSKRANNNEEKNCAMMVFHKGELKWYAENCALPLNYVCQL
ncbi:regenerating islet-derived protein 4-like [Erythrolamprus reginae]|uniref:regenerating islet-derived protein 4-like n=1 Tax=Erythrolamprus reginae TaxID=121349 RepID=UPI00396C4602